MGRNLRVQHEVYIGNEWAVTIKDFRIPCAQCTKRSFCEKAIVLIEI